MKLTIKDLKKIHIEKDSDEEYFAYIFTPEDSFNLVSENSEIILETRNLINGEIEDLNDLVYVIWNTAVEHTQNKIKKSLGIISDDE